MKHERLAEILRNKLAKLEATSWWLMADSRDINKIISLIESREDDKAANMITNLDTIVRDEIPDSVWSWAMNILN